MHAGDAAVGAGLLGILEVGDAEDLVAIDYVDVVADEPLVAHKVLLATIQLDDAVDVATIGEGGLPTPVACLHIERIKGDFDTAVANLTNVAHDGACAGTHFEWGLEVHKEAFRVTVVEVDATVDAVVDEAEVETDVELLGFLPSQVTVREGIAITIGNCTTEVVVVLGVGHRQGLIGTHAGIVTGYTIAHAELQVREPVLCALHECLVVDTPGKGSRWEHTPTLVLGKLARTIPTGADGEQVAVAIVVVDTSYPRKHLEADVLRVDILDSTRTPVVPIHIEGHVGGLVVVAVHPVVIDREEAQHVDAVLLVASEGLDVIGLCIPGIGEVLGVDLLRLVAVATTHLCLGSIEDTVVGLLIRGREGGLQDDLLDG